jgi:hypothetical protein
MAGVRQCFGHRRADQRFIVDDRNVARGLFRTLWGNFHTHTMGHVAGGIISAEFRPTDG